MRGLRKRDGRLGHLRAATLSSSGRGATVLDQAVASGSNFVVLALVARGTDPAHYGLFSGAMAVWLLLLAVSRGLLVEPMILLAPSDPSVVDVAWRRILTWAPITGVGLVLAALVLRQAGMSVVLTELTCMLGATAPCLLLQDAARWRWLALGRPALALRSDTVFAVTELALLALLLHSGDLSVTAALAVVAAGALSAVLVDLPRVRVGSRARREQQSPRLGRWLVLDGLGSWANGYATVLVLGAVTTAHDAGVFRAANDLFGPLRLVQLSASAVLLPAGAAAYARGREAFQRSLLRIGGIVVPGALLYCVVSVTAGGVILEHVYGAAYGVDVLLLAYVAVSYFCNSLQVVLLAGLKAAREARRLAVVRMWTIPTALVALVVGGQWGVRGAALAVAGSALVRTSVMARLLMRVVPSVARRGVRRTPPHVAPVVAAEQS